MSIRVGGFAAGVTCLAALWPCLAIAGAVPGKTNFHVVHYFTAGNDGANPVAGLVVDPWGNIYGVTEYGGLQSSGTVFSTPAGQNKESVLYKFAGQMMGGTDGALPIGGLTIDTQHCNQNTKICMLYGTTSQGGVSGNCSNGCGTIFGIATDGSGYAQLHSFSGSDGANPVAAPVLDSSGNLYGTTLYGGGTGCGGGGCGSVFELASGSFSTLYKFCTLTNCTDGEYPAAPVLIANGNIYGTTELGGANDNGTVFEIQNRNESVVYSFCDIVNVCSGGAQPESGLVMDGSGNFYGTTFTGGTNDSCVGGGCGTAFELSAGGSYSIKQDFSTNQNPQAGLTIDSEGNLYGAIPSGGAAEAGKHCTKGCEYGETYEIPVSGKFTIQHGFDGTNGMGAGPINPPILVSGNLYGTTEFGGYPCPNHTTCGTIYEIEP